MTTLIPKDVTITVSSTNVTGVDGATSRTYTLPHASVSSIGMRVYVNGAFLHQGASFDYTLASNIITFVNALWNGQIVSVYYYITASNAADASLEYSTVLGFVQHINALGTIPNNQVTVSSEGTTTNYTTYEEVGTGNNSRTSFWLDRLGVIENEYIIYYGASAESTLTALTESTHYSLDLDTSEITLTASGVTAVGTNKIFAKYKYCIYGLLNSEISTALIAAQEKLKREIEMTFATYEDSDPGYRKVTNEIKEAHYLPTNKVFDVFWNPIVKIHTTVGSAYTTGGVSLVLTDGTGFPNAGTIYIGGNKVTYTAKSTNTLTVPSTTPSISAGATVRGEVVEVSKEAEGNAPSYTVLTPDTEYKINYLNGRVQLLDNAYWGELSNSDVTYPADYKVRLCYMHAWYQEGDTPFVPSDLEEATNMIAAKKFMQRLIAKAYIQGNNKFNPTMVETTDNEIQRIIDHYRTLKVGTSLYNKQSVS